MTFKESQAKVVNMIRVRVYEVLWGGSVMDHIQYFESVEAIHTFHEQTGHRVEALVTGIFEGKPYELVYSFKETGEFPCTVDRDFTDEERLQIMTSWEIENIQSSVDTGGRLMKTWTNEQGTWIVETLGELDQGAFIRFIVRRKQWHGETPVFDVWDAEFIRKGTEKLFGGNFEEDQIHLLHMNGVKATPRYVRNEIIRMAVEVLSENGIEYAHV